MAYDNAMRAKAVHLTVVAVLGLGLASQATAFVQRASACQSILETREDRPDCCDRGASILLQKEGGDCCETVDVSPLAPAAQSSTHSLAQAQVAVVPRPTIRMPAPRAAHEPWRETLERGPPYPPATENIVLLN